MKKMGGKKADGLSNVNYNEIQKTILQEVTYCSLYIFYITFCITSDAIKIEPNTAVFYY